MGVSCKTIWWIPVSVTLAGCYTAQPRPNPAVAPPLPVPTPMGPGQAPPIQQQPVGPSNIPLPPGSPTVPAAPLTAAPSYEHGRVQAMAQRLYQANPWLKLKPVWVVQPGDTPGVAAQGDQYVIISENLVRSASDGQLAAVMALQLGDMTSSRQRAIAEAARGTRRTANPPDYYSQRRPGEQETSSTLRDLELADYAKQRNEPRDPIVREQQTQCVDPPTLARQVLVQAGFAPQELDSAGPLLQRFPPVRSVRP
jgi:hypothetical protein